MSKTSKLKKAKPRKIPLSFLDQFIYIFLFIFGLGLSFFTLILFTIIIPKRIVFSDPSVILAQTAVNHSLPLALTIAFSSLIMVRGITNKQPIFGNKHFKPRWDQPVLKTYPIFSKEFKENLSEKSKTKCKKIALIIAFFLIVSIAILPLGFCWQQTIDSDYNFSSRNCFNRETHCANIKDAEFLSIDVASNKGSYYINMTFSFEDKKYTFPLGCFSDDMSAKECLEHALKFKSFFAEDEYKISKEYRVPRLIDYMNWNQIEADLVYELFECN